MNRIKTKLTYANLVASIALFGVLGGGAYAASHATKNSVVSSSIANQQVRSADIKDNNVRSTDVKDGALQSQDLAAGVIPTVPNVDTDASRTYYDGSPEQTLPAQPGRVLEVQVPAGTYTAHADLEVYVANGPSGQGECRFRALGGSPTLLGYTGTLFLGDVIASGNIDERFISMGGAFTTTGGVVEMACSSVGGTLGTLAGDLVVTEVSSIDAQS